MEETSILGENSITQNNIQKEKELSEFELIKKLINNWDRKSVLVIDPDLLKKIEKISYKYLIDKNEIISEIQNILKTLPLEILIKRAIKYAIQSDRVKEIKHAFRDNNNATISDFVKKSIYDHVEKSIKSKKKPKVFSKCYPRINQNNQYNFINSEDTKAITKLLSPARSWRY